MAGIYLHIPFCKTRCAYCDFYSSTHSELQSRYVNTLCAELSQRRDYLQDAPISTVYIGGGTPSQLKASHLAQIFNTIELTYGLQQAQEVTIEANPDDLTDDYLQQLKQLPINRISMGVQTFNDATLRLLNRRHTAAQAREAVERCRRHGFRNISIDLIYGLPGETEEQWQNDLQQAITLHPEHLSAYHLTYEEGTPLHRLLQQHRISEVSEEQSVLFFKQLRHQLQAAGYEHYEISNFSLPGLHSRHNSSYWQGIPYLGCGPSAHSFNGTSREWNAPALTQYIEAIERGERLFEREELSENTRYNEMVMTALRTAHGINIHLLEEQFGLQRLQYCLRQAQPHLQAARLKLEAERLKLTEEGIFVSDDIISDLMFVD